MDLLKGGSVLKNVLLTNLMLCDFTGSELHILSIAKQFKKRGYEVICAVVYSAYPMRYLAEEYGIKIIHITEEKLPCKHYDVIFGQHGLVLDYLIFHNNISFKNLILSILSPIELFEYPSYFSQNAQIILANSQETKIKLIRDGISKEKIKVFPNYAEEEFFNKYSIATQKKLEKILIVSNHLPEEIIGLRNILEANNFVCDVIGIQGEKVLVTADKIQQYDLVISIGKTIQYCFAQGIPVYCYDIWGGPGYIEEKNFAQAEAYNFSGRGFERKLNAQELYVDIQEGYEQALEQLEWLNKIAQERYDLNKNFENIIDMFLSEEEKVVEYKEQVLSNLKVSNEALIREVYHRIKNNLFYTEVYYDYGKGFQEENKQVYPIVGNSTITLNTSIPLGVKRIRFDPVGGVFSRCSLKEINNEKAENKIIGSNRAKTEYGKDVFYTFDPQYELQADVQESLGIKYSVEIVPNYKVEELLSTCITAMQYNQVYKEMVQEKDSALAEKDKLISKQTNLIEEKDRRLQEKDNLLYERGNKISECNKQMDKNRLQIEDLKRINALQQQQLREIYSSRYWKLGQVLKKYLKR